MPESKEYIKSRMLKNASRSWGHPETEAENNFDPLVSMLLSACSGELEKISGDIQTSRGRVLERLVHLLSPEVLTGALPAHAVAWALPVENSIDLPADSQLYTALRLPSISGDEKQIHKDVFFSPTGTFSLNRASVCFMATGRILYKITNTINKEIVAQSDSGKELPPSTLWLGINEPEVSLHDARYYFDLRNEADKSLFYNQLPKANWFLDNRKLQPVPGYGNGAISGESFDPAGISGRSYNVRDEIKKQINAFYKSNFITLRDVEGVTNVPENNIKIPAVLTDTFDAKITDVILRQPLRWICVSFPENVFNRLLHDVVCIMNCFPVMNRRLHHLNYRLQEIVNIIPLQTKDIFLDLEEVCDEEEKPLNVRCFGEEGEDSPAMLMRHGGVGRFDERDAASMVEHLLQLLRDESSAFAALGNDFLNSELKQLQQVINRLEQRLFARQLHTGQTPYLIIRNHQKKHWRHLFIRYWSTNGAGANNIKAGTSIQLYKGEALHDNKAILVTATKGGRNKLNTTEAVLAYKSALLSKDRVITSEDIKALCHYQLGTRVEHIEVKKGVMVHPDQYQGFLKTLDVIISIHKKPFGEMQEKGELGFWTENLTLLLEEKSATLMPYRIFIQEGAGS